MKNNTVQPHAPAVKPEGERGSGVKERPILFSGPMVRAIRERRKTQTRRVMKPQPTYDGLPVMRISPLLAGRDCHKTGEFMKHHPQYDRVVQSGLWCPYGVPGDRLWVRETLGTLADESWIYSADCLPVMVDPDNETAMLVWCHHKEQNYCPSIYMPRWASRITLEITEVRAERLRDISEEDAITEGVTVESDWTACMNFAKLWSSIHKADGPNGWAANPWVWAISFQSLENTQAAISSPQGETK